MKDRPTTTIRTGITPTTPSQRAARVIESGAPPRPTVTITHTDLDLIALTEALRTENARLLKILDGDPTVQLADSATRCLAMNDALVETLEKAERELTP